MASAINCLESQEQGRLSSQLEANPKKVSAMTLRSGMEIEGPKSIIPKDKSNDQIEKEMEEEGFIKATSEVTPSLVIQIKSNPTPFSSRLEKLKKQDQERERDRDFKSVSKGGNQYSFVGRNQTSAKIC